MSTPPSSRSNPLRQDPSRTLTLRKSAVAEVRWRYRSLSQAILNLVGDSDVFGVNPPRPIARVSDLLKTPPQSPSHPPPSISWRWFDIRDKLAQFSAWLAEQIPGHGWCQRYISEAFYRGLSRSYDDIKRIDRSMASSPESWHFYSGGKTEFVRRGMSDPKSQSAVGALVARAYTALQAVIDALTASMTQLLANELQRIASSALLSEALTEVVNLYRSRAETVMRTEIVRAHADGQLTGMAFLGVERVGVMLEWASSGDGEACPQCASTSRPPGPITLSQAAAIIPHHPNCRCAWVPVRRR